MLPSLEAASAPGTQRASSAPSIHAGGSAPGLAVQRLQTPADLERYGEKLALWAYNTGPRYFDYIFGDVAGACRNLKAWIGRDSSEFSGKLCYLLSVDRVAAGCLIVVPGAEVAPRRRADTLTLIKNCPSAQRPALLLRLAALHTTLPPVQAEELYIRCFSIDQSCLGRGLGRAFLQRVIADSQRCGANRFRLEVEADNGAASALYRKLGFVVTHSASYSSLHVDVHSMALALPSA